MALHLTCNSEVWKERTLGAVIMHMPTALNARGLIADRDATWMSQAKMQEKLCKLPARYKRLAEMSLDRVKKQPKHQFSWIFEREA